MTYSWYHSIIEHFGTWIDGVGRQFASADYGTNGGAAFTRPATVPTRSDTILVNTTSYNDDGEVFATLDPQSTETRLEYDDAGRQTAQIENYVSGGTNADQNRTTWTIYTADGQVATLTASNNDTGNQQTAYTYGTTLANSGIASSQLLRFVRYPDSDGTNGDFVTWSYNRQGQQTLVIDQRGCQHAYDYDKLGRQIHDRVPSLGSSAVGTVRRLSTVYDSRGMVLTVTTWDDPRVGFGSVQNQVLNAYNDFGQQTASCQSHSGTANISTGETKGDIVLSWISRMSPYFSPLISPSLWELCRCTQVTLRLGYGLSLRVLWIASVSVSRKLRLLLRNELILARKCRGGAKHCVSFHSKKWNTRQWHFIEGLY
ncbi:MAG TPA: hypothetical protein PLY87_12285 [Planctomycetaceae bacterium]|nr:hypothetical protein [Planctomycetaceae bacterium]HQZ65854.1 hypothetical protein [Planctomycetaceae bacterium]